MLACAVWQFAGEKTHVRRENQVKNFAVQVGFAYKAL